MTLISMVLIMGAMACKKVPDGFLSDYVRYEVTPIVVPQGRAYVSDALNPEGSAKPMTVKLLAVYNAETGENVTEIFSKKYTIPVWTGFYDPKKDTTLEMINAKRKDSLVYPISINQFSGQLEANFATINLPLGLYDYDLEIKNSTGTKVYPKIGQFQLKEAAYFENPDPRTTVAMKVGAESTTKTLPGGRIEVKHTNEDVNKIVVRIVDENGVAFNPKEGEIGRRPMPGTGIGWLQTMQDYALSYEEFDDRMEFEYGVNPFPLSSLGNGYNYYYRIPTEFVKFDESLELPDNEYSCNARFSLRVYLPGTYEVTVIVDGVTKK
jgi:hypothetical protein